MADKKLSIAEMLAAARKADGGGDGEATPAEPEAAAPAEEQPQADAAQASETSSEPAKAMDRSKMSVADMLAAARAGGGAAEKSKPAAKPAAKKPAAKAKSAAKPTATKASGPKDTASILAAARNAAKPGPISKAEAAAKKSDAAEPSKPKSVVPPMPVRPSFAKKTSAKSKKKAGAEERRSFLSAMFGTALGIGFTSLAATSSLMAAGMARFMFPNILNEPPSSFPVGFPDDFGTNQVETKYKAQFGVWIVNANYGGQQQIYALSTVCTHLGCTPNWLEAEQKYKCPCHGSGFYKDGINFEGPAPRPLERYAISIASDGQLVVDKSKKFQEELGQWDNKESYVPI